MSQVSKMCIEASVEIVSLRMVRPEACAKILSSGVRSMKSTRR